MPATETVILFMAAALALNVTPGPSIAYVTSRSFGQGRTAATLGLAAVLAYSPMAYAVVKYVGAAYVVYLGVGLLRRRTVRLADVVPPRLSLSWVYWQGVLTEILNPKVALFFLSFLPQFVDPARGSVAGETLFFGLLSHVTGVPINMLVAVAGSAIAAAFSRNPLLERIRNWLSGAVLIGLGVRLALSERR